MQGKVPFYFCENVALENKREKTPRIPVLKKWFSFLGRVHIGGQIYVAEGTAADFSPQTILPRYTDIQLA
jgi:hypothetical protein